MAGAVNVTNYKVTNSQTAATTVTTVFTSGETWHNGKRNYSI